MAANKVYLVTNLKFKPCQHCGKNHKYMSRSSPQARCGTPLGMSLELAEQVAMREGLDLDEAVVVVPDDTVVVLDDSARKLKQQGGETVPMDQVYFGLRLA